MTTPESVSIELTRQLAQDIRELRQKVDEIDGKVDQQISVHTHRLDELRRKVDGINEKVGKLEIGLNTHRVTGNGETEEDGPRKRLPFGLTVKDLLLFALVGELAGSNLLEYLGVL